MINQEGVRPSDLFDHCRRHPEQAQMLITACVEGLQAAVKDANRHAGECGFAMLGAFILQDEKRVPQHLRETFLAQIASVINPANASPIEKRMLAKADLAIPLAKTGEKL